LRREEGRRNGLATVSVFSLFLFLFVVLLVKIMILLWNSPSFHVNVYEFSMKISNEAI